MHRRLRQQRQHLGQRQRHQRQQRRHHPRQLPTADRARRQHRADHCGRPSRQRDQRIRRACAEGLPSGVGGQSGVRRGQVAATRSRPAVSEQFRRRREQHQHSRRDVTSSGSQGRSRAALQTQRNRRCRQADQHSQGQHQASRRQHQGLHGDSPGRDQPDHDRRRHDSRQQIPHRVDVRHQPPLALPGFEAACRTQAHQRIPEPNTQPSGDPEGGVVRHEPFDIPESGPAESERAHPDDRDRQGQNRRLQRSFGDQPARGRGEGDPGQERQGT